MKQNSLPPELLEIDDDLQLFDDEGMLEIWRNNFKGIQWTDEKGNLFRGAVDNILKKGGKLIVLDYKTRGYPLKEDTADHYQDQMDIYNFLLRKNGYETEEYAYLLFYHPDCVNENGDVIFNTDLVKMSISVQNAEEIFNRAITVLSGEIPVPASEGKYCAWTQVTKDY